MCKNEAMVLNWNRSCKEKYESSNFINYKLVIYGAEKTQFK